jgi:HAD superfamily hydrolase (TIGR01509 family)
MPDVILARSTPFQKGPMLNIVFDCDGTLVDSEPLHNRADVDVLARYGVFLDPIAHQKRATGIGRAAMLRTIEQEHGIKLPADMEQQIEAELHRLVALELKVIPSVPSVLSALAKDGARMAVASNSPRMYIEQALRRCAIREFFSDRIASCDLVQHLKPAPDLYLLAAKLLESAPQVCVAVEDSHVGVAAAHAAGMRVIGFCPLDHVFTPEQLLQAGAESIITDFAGLLDVLDGGEVRTRTRSH